MSVFVFHRALLRPGLIVSMCSCKPTAWLIRRALRREFNALGPDALKVTPEVFNHDAILIKGHNQWYVGDAQPWRARLTPLEQYERDVNSGYLYNLRIFEAKGATHDQEEDAAAWWLENINGAWYDFMAYPRLILKVIFGDYWQWAAGWEWARWCTEGVSESYLKGAKFDVYHKTNPTPLTTVKRAISGDLTDITNHVSGWEIPLIDRRFTRRKYTR